MSAGLACCYPLPRHCPPRSCAAYNNRTTPRRLLLSHLLFKLPINVWTHIITDNWTDTRLTAYATNCLIVSNYNRHTTMRSSSGPGGGIAQLLSCTSSLWPTTPGDVPCLQPQTDQLTECSSYTHLYTTLTSEAIQSSRRQSHNKQSQTRLDPLTEHKPTHSLQYLTFNMSAYLVQQHTYRVICVNLYSQSVVNITHFLRYIQYTYIYIYIYIYNIRYIHLLKLLLLHKENVVV